MSWRRLLPPLAVAILLRFSGLAWDGWYHQHPDERFLVMVAEKLAFPKSLSQALDPYRTPLNPQNGEFSFFVYGALFPNLNYATARLLGMAHYTGLLKTGRALSASFDCLALLLFALLVARLSTPQVGVWVAWLWAFLGILVQNARFGTADALGLFAVSLTLFYALREVRLARAVLSGLGVGLAAATRPNLVTLALPVTLAVLLLPLAKPHRRPFLPRLCALAAAGLAALVVWKLLDPGFFASTLSPLPNPRRLASFRELSAMMSGEGQYPPNLQWAQRGPLFLLWNVAFWGTGPALGLALVWAAAASTKRLLLGDRRVLVAWAWLVPMVLVQATRLVCSVRHFLPTLPFFLLLLALAARRWKPSFRAGVLALTVPWGVAWAALAWQPYTRLQASQFLRAHFPEGTVVATEAWDDGLPTDFGAERYVYREIPVYAPDTQEKREELLAILQEAQVIALSSQRGVGSVCRVPDAYPLMSEFYHLLFSGELGFSLVFHDQRRLGWGAWGLSHLGAEETLSVYDHPPVWIFAKTARYDHALVTALLGRVPLPERTDWHTRELEARGLPPYLQRHSPLAPLPPNWGRGTAAQVASLAFWLLAVEWVGLLGTGFLHLGVGLKLQTAALAGRPFGLLAVAMALLWSGSLGVWGWQGLVAGVLGLGATLLSWRALRELWKTQEVRFARYLFLLPFAFFLAVRAYNPEIYWGEKPMDAGIFTLLLRSPELPPQDPWFAGYPVNYYFFGFLPYVFLATVSGAPPSVAFNLATATVPALAFGAAAACGFAISGRRSGAWLAGLLTQVAGTAYLLVRPAHLLAPNFDRFWASSRVIPEGINEYPVWTALFADLHAHFLSFPGFLLAFALLGELIQRGTSRRSLLFPLGLLLASQYMSNTWEIPALAFLLVVALGLAFFGQDRGLVRATSFFVTAGVLAALLAWPFLIGQHVPRGGFFWEKGQAVSFGQYVELYGVHAGVFLLALAAGWRFLAPRLRAWVLAVGLLAFVFIFGPSYLTLVDKMNSYFKLGLQAFLLLGATGGGVLAVCLGKAVPWARRLALGGAGVFLALGLLQAGWDAWAVIATRRVPGPRPTLDGAAYLEGFQPAVAAAVPLLTHRDPGVVAEVATPSYGDNLRLPMFCGTPAVVGWDYHLWQRGKSRAEIRLRLHDLEVLLRGSPRELANALARRWRVGVLARWEEKPAGLPGFRAVAGTDGHVWVRGEP